MKLTARFEFGVGRGDGLPGLVKALRGQVPSLLRHPCAAAVISELYSVASTQQRNLMASEFYGKEFVVFGEVCPSETPSSNPRLGHCLEVAGW